MRLFVHDTSAARQRPGRRCTFETPVLTRVGACGSPETCVQPWGVARLPFRYVATSALAVLGLTTVVVATGEPVESARCLWQSRNGWTVEFPRESLPEELFLREIEAQTTCVDIAVVYVNADVVDEGHVARPVGAKGHFVRGDIIWVLVESDNSDAVECGAVLPIYRESYEALETLGCPTESPPG